MILPDTRQPQGNESCVWPVPSSISCSLEALTALPWCASVIGGSASCENWNVMVFHALYVMHAAQVIQSMRGS